MIPRGSDPLHTHFVIRISMSDLCAYPADEARFGFGMFPCSANASTQRRKLTIEEAMQMAKQVEEPARIVLRLENNFTQRYTRLLHDFEARK
jgi:hypothetical protein